MELKTKAQKQIPDLGLEFEFFNSGIQFVGGIDEVGRGSLAGPVAVGVVVISKDVGPVPEKLTDSKLISKSLRETLVPQIEKWALDYEIGYSTSSEIDEIGIVGALRLAASRAICELRIKPDQIILDGKHNWLVDKSASTATDFQVVTKIKADQSCATVAAASVLAKVARDNLMAQADLIYPDYGFAKNVGYGSAAHMAAIQKHGPSQFHRRSWNLPKAN